MDFVNEIISSINAQASMAGAVSMFASSSFDKRSDVLEQEVTIHAEFPNVTQRNEIEEAFNNLINRASQYANRK